MIKTAALACSYCEASFPSRNELFRHLRDTKTECGDKVAQQGGIAFGAGRKNRRDALQARLAKMGVKSSSVATTSSAAATGSKAKDLTNGDADNASSRAKTSNPSKGHRKRKLGDRIARRFATSHDQELWMGDIPAAYATKKALGNLLWRACRVGEPAPIVKRVFKKGWRENKKAFTASQPKPGDYGSTGSLPAADPGVSPGLATTSLNAEPGLSSTANTQKRK